MHFINRVRFGTEEMCSYLVKGKCNSFLPVEQSQNLFLCQTIILRIVYRIDCVLLLELAQLSKTKDESWKFLAPSSNSSFEFLYKPAKPSNFYFNLESFRDTDCWPFSWQLSTLNPKVFVQLPCPVHVTWSCVIADTLCFSRLELRHVEFGKTTFTDCNCFFLIYERKCNSKCLEF